MNLRRLTAIFTLLLSQVSSPLDYKASKLCTGSSVKENTRALNCAIAEKLKARDRLIFNDRGRTVDYVLGSLSIVNKDSIAIVIDTGVTIQGSPNADHDSGDYDKAAEYALIYIKESRGISISGSGTIDGNTSDSTWLTHQKRGPGQVQQWWDCSQYQYKVEDDAKAPNSCIYVKDCSKPTRSGTIGAGNITIEGITINRAYQDAIWLRRCNTVRIANVTINNFFVDRKGIPSYYMGGDGIDIDLSSNVTVSHTDVISSDDAICIKSLHERGAPRTSYHAENITVTDCNVRTPTNGLKIGTETCDDISNVQFINCTVDAPPHGTGPFGGVAIMTTDGSHIRNVLVKGIRIRNAKAPFFVKIGARMKFQTENETSALSDIMFENIAAEIDTPYSSIASSISGYAHGKVSIPVRNVTLKDITFIVRGGVNDKARFIPEPEVPEDHDGYPQSDMFQYRFSKKNAGKRLELPCYGIYFRNIRGLVMDNVNVTTLRNEKDIRPRFVFNDVEFGL